MYMKMKVKWFLEFNYNLLFVDSAIYLTWRFVFFFIFWRFCFSAFLAALNIRTEYLELGNIFAGLGVCCYSIFCFLTFLIFLFSSGNYFSFCCSCKICRRRSKWTGNWVERGKGRLWVDVYRTLCWMLWYLVEFLIIIFVYFAPTP